MAAFCAGPHRAETDFFVSGYFQNRGRNGAKQNGRAAERSR
jgi:hypothetical protein